MAATVSANLVRELCTAPEAALVRASRDRRVRDVSITDLRAKRDRARDLRDKFRALAERQRREARGKQSPRGATASKSNDRTVMKQQIFAEALANFDRRIKAVEAQSGGTSGGTSAGRPAKKSAGKSAGKTANKRGASSLESAKRSDRQATRKKLRIETKTTDRPVAKRAGKGSAATSSAASSDAKRMKAAGGSRQGSGANAAGGRKTEGGNSGTPAAATRAARTSAPPAPAAAPAASSREVRKKRAGALHSILGTETSSGGVHVTSIPLDAESVVRAGELDPMALRTPEVAARSSHLVLDRSARIERTGAVKIQAHIGSRNRRNQAKRDSAG